jgi:hypothetical protein
MTNENGQLDRFRDALDEKERENEKRAHENADDASALANQDQLAATDETQDTQSVRAKNSGHGKKTADKWNQ